VLRTAAVTSRVPPPRGPDKATKPKRKKTSGHKPVTGSVSPPVADD
jgi:hypothetical protein